MALQKYVPSGNVSSVKMKSLAISNEVHKNDKIADLETNGANGRDVDIDYREVYFLIMHFLSAGPCHRTFGQFWNELLENQLLPRRYHAWFSRNGDRSGDENDDGISFPLSYNSLVERYPHVEKDHLVKLLKQLVLTKASTPQSLVSGSAPNAADVPTLLGTGSFSLLNHDRGKRQVQGKTPAYMRWPHIRADQVRGLTLRELGGGFTRHHRSPSVRAASYCIAKPSTMVQKMQNIKRVRGHRNSVYCAILDRSGRYVVTGSDDRLVKIWSMETAFCLASCRGHEGDITDLAVTSNNTMVASASNDCVIRVWRLPDGLPVSVLRGHTGAVTTIAFSPRPGSAYQLLSSADDGTCRLWDVRAPHSSPRIYVPKPSDSVTGRSNGPSSISAPQSHQVFCCAFNASGTVFVTGSSDNLARVWNACKPTTEDAAEPIHEIDVLSGHENDVNYVQFSGCAVVSRANLIDIQKEDNVPKFRNSWFSHDNIVTCSRDGSAIIWIPRSRRSHGKTSRWTRAYHLKVPPPPMPPQPPRGGPRQRTLPTPRGVNMIVWSLDNRFVLAAIMDCRICVWNAADGSLVHCLTGHTSSTYVLDVHPSNPRIAMSAGYDGKLIVWDIWEGTPIRIYEISHFKLVDGKFSPDGTSIILSDDVGQLYILNTGQGESQEDAKYDQFFLGDYRPLIQDSYGNVLDQETQLVPYRRNMQDLLCDSGMIPYPEPYQSMYQKRRLGALGMEWKPSSIRFAAGPDFSLDPDYQMLPLADLDTWIEPLPPLPEFVDAMGWEPEIEIGSDSNDSEYNVMEEYSSGGDQGSVDASSTGELECSAEDSEVEDRDSYRRSKRKKQRAETEIMTSSGRRVKRRNLDEADDNSVKNNRPRKSKTDRKKLKKKSSKGNASRPRRAAARNALSLFSKITGTTSDGEDEEGSEGDFSESDSSLQDSDMGNDSDKVLGSEGSERRKGKDVIHGMSPDYAVSNEYSDVPLNPGGNRRKLVLRLPARDYNKMVLHESGTSKCGNMASFVGSSSKASGEGRQFTGIDANFKDLGSSSGDANCGMRVQEGRGHADNHHLDLLDGYRNGCDLRWKGTKIRSFKRQRLGGESSGPNESAISVSAFKDKEENLNGFSDLHQDNGTMIPALDVKQSQEKINGLTTTNGEIVADSSCNYAHPSSNGSVHAEKSLQPANVVNGNDNCSSELTDGLRPVSTMLSINSKDTVDEQENGRNGSLHGNPADIKQTTVSEASDHDGTHKMDSEDKVLLADAQIAEKSGPPQDNSLGVNYPKKTYTNVYRRAKSAKGKSKLESNGVREDHSKAGSDDSNTRDDLNRVKEGMANCAHKLHSSSQKAPDEENTTSNNLSLGHTHESDDQNGVARQDSVNGHILPSEEWASSSRTTVGLRSARNRKTSFYFRDTSPVERRKPQSTKRLSWLMLSMHEEGSRYIPQLGDEVVYLRQGHQEYIAYSGSREAGPWKMVKGCIRAVELCKVEGLEYATRAGSGDSCCKMILKFIDSTSDVFQKSFRFTLPEVTGFPDFLVEKTRFDVSMQRNWTSRDKCRVWWKNEGEEDGSWWDGRILSVKPKSSEFPDSPWEKYTIQYRSDPTETHLHSPWELFDSDTQWEQPCIDDKTRQKLLSALAKLEKSGKKAQDHYGVQKLRQVSQKSNFTNRFPVPLSLEVIQLRLENNYYRNMMAVRHDIEVMLSNAESYFGKNADVSAKIRRLSDWFEKTLSSL